MNADICQDGEQEENSVSCNCPSQSILQTQRTAIFSKLDASQKYFAMVAKDGPNTFYGAPPDPIQPRSVSITVDRSETVNDTQMADVDHIPEQEKNEPSVANEENVWETGSEKHLRRGLICSFLTTHPAT